MILEQAEQSPLLLHFRDFFDLGQGGCRCWVVCFWQRRPFSEDTGPEAWMMRRDPQREEPEEGCSWAGGEQVKRL